MDFTDETIPMPRIGDQAPVFDAVTTQGKIHFPLDFSGKWIILFSHPSDFTPVCTSEFVTFGAMTEEFKALNCQLIGLSVDGLYSHIAWLRTIREKIEYKGKKNVEVQFPLIADVTMEARPTLSVPYFTSIRKESSGPLSIIRWLWDEISTN